ncbi:MAG: sporulation and cell division protein SsgA [Frankiales bacterium]|nr:sporulation and cell division protein SsgA [Frankiales bacterium]
MTIEVTVEVVIDDGPRRHTVLRLCWMPADPYAVRLHLTALPEHPALPRGRWVVLRDSLREGLRTPTGDGLVKIGPDDVRDRIWLELDRPGRAACISVPRRVVADFLAETEGHVPYGQEAGGPAVDALLDRVLYSS